MIRLLLVDDQNLICQGLAAVLDQEPDFEVVGTAENGQRAIDLVPSLHPHIILMDIRMPVMTGIEATRLITTKFPEIKILVLSTFDDDLDITYSMQAGAKGYLLKDMPAPELAEAIRLTSRGYGQMAPGLIEKLLTRVVPEAITPPQPPEIAQLPAREQDVLRLIGQGHTNREIASQLHLAEGTVKTYVTHLLNRLTLKNRSQLAIYANSMRQYSVPKGGMESGKVSVV
ncbi:MAG: response regulator transcription factor [Oculatellaceae cyanobacterium Prado106]|jgi:DNA-binding NarL/FixJ family response regulator|nr:response regulator transcription factor [Oculatellaceae cyanobacterium Prado106]